MFFHTISDTRFIALFYVKNEVSVETNFFLIFILDQFRVKLNTLSLAVTFVEECYSDMRFIALFYVKNEVSTETIFIFIFYLATVSREN